MDLLGFNVNARVHERWCRFIIHRYLGHALEKNLQLEQLTVDLINGSVTVNQVMLNVQYLNDQLVDMNMPLRLVDGFIGSIRICIPWRSLMGESTKVELHDVQLTLRGADAFKADKDLVSSMIGSMVESLVSPKNLVQSFKEEETEFLGGIVGDEDNSDSVHAFALVVDAMVSRFCCEVKQLIVRVESDATPSTDLSTAIELHVESVQFLDEQLAAGKKDAISPEAITAQPKGVSSVADLNKYFIVHGVQIFTDVFSKTEQQVNDAMSPVTSMYLRREHQKASIYKSVSSPITDSVCTNLYQSCHSQAGHSEQSPQSNEAFKPFKQNSHLMSCPVKFADIPGETRILVRIKNSDIAPLDQLNSKIEFEINADVVSVFFTASQLSIAKIFLDAVLSDAKIKKTLDVGKPMGGSDFDVVHKQLEEIIMESDRARTNRITQTGNWRGIDDFRNFQSISLSNDPPRASKLSHEAPVSSSLTHSFKTESSAKAAESANIKLNLETLLLYISHGDPLCVDEVDKLEGGAPEACAAMQSNTKHYFEEAKIFHKHDPKKSTLTMEERAVRLFSKDHLRLIGSGVSLTYSVEAEENDADRLYTRIAFQQCEMTEYLAPSSSSDLTEKHIPLLNFDREGKGGTQLALIIRNEEHKTAFDVNLAGVTSELDPSMIDRISDLLSTRPFFKSDSFAKRYNYQHGSVVPGLKEDLFSETPLAKPRAEREITVVCPDWTIFVRVPKVDLTDECNSSKFTVRNLHEESLKLHLKSCEIRVPAKKKNGPRIVEITCMELVGQFLGDADKLRCTEEESTFLYGGGKNQNPIRFKLEYDHCNRILRTKIGAKLLPMGAEDMAKSFSAEYMQKMPKRDGPFSQVPTSYTEQTGDGNMIEIIEAGCRGEMESFSQDCLEQSAMSMQVDVPEMRVHLPNHDFLEILYNRIVNDLALWETRSPAFRKNQLYRKNSKDGFKEFKSWRDRTSVDSDEEEEEYERRSRAEDIRSANKNAPHLLSVCLDVGRGVILLGTQTIEEKRDPVLAQVVGDMQSLQIFLAYGYRGDPNRTFFYLTTNTIDIAQRNGHRTMPCNVRRREFGQHEKSEVQVATLGKQSALRAGRDEDAFAVAFSMLTRPKLNVKDSMIAVALRMVDMKAAPLRSWSDWWLSHLKNFFTVVDYDIAGYDMPQVSTDLHLTLEQVMLSYDHSLVKKASDLRMKMALGNVHITSSFVPESETTKFLVIFEEVHLYMTRLTSKDEEIRRARKVKYADAIDFVEATPDDEMVHVMELGLFQMEVSYSEDTLNRTCPLVDLQCKNDDIKVWICSDSLATFVNVVSEIMNCDLWSADQNGERDEERSELADEEMRSVSCHSNITKASSRSKHLSPKPLSAAATRRIRAMVESACNGTPETEHPPQQPSSYSRSTGIPEGRDALYEWSNQTPFDQELLEDTMMEPEPFGNAALSGDEEFCMVEDIVGVGITSPTGANVVKKPGKTKLPIYNDTLHYSAPREISMNGVSLPKDYPVPLARYVLKDISFTLHIYAGNDLGTERGELKSYSAGEYREGAGRSQVLKPEARGGKFRDHSASVVVQVNKLCYTNLFFSKQCDKQSMIYFGVQSFTVHDRLTLSNIKEMIYQFSSQESPIRSFAPMLSCRTVDNHLQEGRMKVSVLPIRLNLDQDTLEFMEDFFETFIKLLHLKENQNTMYDALQQRPMIEVPACDLPPLQSSRSSRSSASRQPRPPTATATVAPLPSTVPLQPLPSPRPPPERPARRQSSEVQPLYNQLRDLDALNSYEKPPAEELESSSDDLENLARSPLMGRACDVPPGVADAGELGELDDLETLERKSASAMQARLDSLKAARSASQPVNDMAANFSRSSRFDMRDSTTSVPAATASTGDFQGDWASNSEIRYPSIPTKPEVSVDDLLARSTMDGSVYLPGRSDDEEEASDEEDNETICSEAPSETGAEDEFIRGHIFYKEFTFDPSLTIHIDYQGKSKINIERNGAMLSMFRGFANLDKSQVTLKAIHHRNGLLGVSRCISFALNEWSDNIRENIPGVLTTVGPISPLVQIGKGIFDLFWLPMEELRSENGHVVRGLQRGVGSFGMSTAAAVVDLAQRFVGVVNVAAETVLHEVTPEHPALNNRNRRPLTNRTTAPTDLRHGIQLSYDLITDGVQQTREDIELATQEDRASGRSSMRAVIRYATPSLLRPLVISSQIGYQLLAGLKNQLRPDQFLDEQHKYRPPPKQ